MRTDRRYGTYAVMAHLAALDLTVMWDTGRGASTAATTSRAILQTIANFVDSDNGWAAGNEAISEHCDGMSEKTIRRHLKRAEEVGIITRTRKQTGTYRARHRVQFELDLTQQQLVSNSAAHPHQPNAAPRGGSTSETTVAELEAELARMRALLGTAENQVADTVTATHDSAESPVDNSTGEDQVAVTDDRFRSGHGRPLPKRTTHINQYSSSSSAERPATETTPIRIEEEEEENSQLVSDDLVAAFQQVHPEIRVELLLRRLTASGVDPAGVDLIAAATEIFETRRGQRIGDPTAYVAASISRESWRWPANGSETWEQALGTDGATSAPPVAACSQGVHRWVPLADGRAFCGICTIDRTDAAIELRNGSASRVA